MNARLTLRSLARNPGFTAIAVAVLALGICASTTIFSVVYSLLLKPLPFRDAHQLYQIWLTIPDGNQTNLSPREYQTLAARTKALQSVAYWTGNGFTISHRGEASFLIGVSTSPNFFNVLGAQPFLGRAFTPQDAQPGSARGVVISHRLWRNRFGSDPAVLGQTITCNNRPCQILGVMARDFAYPDTRRDLWYPVTLSEDIFARFPDAHMLRTVGRLANGATPENLNAEMPAFLTAFRELDPSAIATAVHPQPVRDWLSQGTQQPLGIASIAVAALLLIACINIANLMLARATGRFRELAVRAVLGAGRARLAGLLLGEALALAIIGGALGIALSNWTIEALASFGSASLSGLEHVRLEWPVLAFSAVLSASTALLFGVLPAWNAARVDVNDSLKAGARSVAFGDAKRSTALILAEVALSFVLLAAAGLLLRSFWNLTRQQPGFSGTQAVSMFTLTGDVLYPNAKDLVRFMSDFQSRLRSLPGVEAAGATSHLPFDGDDWSEGVDIEGLQVKPGDTPTARAHIVTPEYLETIGIPIVAGRSLNEFDNANRKPVAIVNQAFVDKYLAGRNPLAVRIRVTPEWREIAGVVANSRHLGLDEQPKPEFYIAYEQTPPELLGFMGRGMRHVVRGTLDFQTLATSARRELKLAAPGVALEQIETLSSKIEQSVSEPRFRTWLIGLFALMALALASAGIYGVMSFLVAQRSREIGLRIALGAVDADVWRLVFGRVLIMTAAGIGLGLLGTIWVGRILASLLFGVNPMDWLVLTLVGSILVVVALAACLVPAWRATRVDPMVALRQDG